MMLFKLALSNIKKSFKDYSIYFITLVISVAVFYLFNSIEDQQVMLSINEMSKMMLELVNEIMGGASFIVAIILGFLVVYANNFILRRRKKEIGLYMTLGMSKSKVSFIFVLETFFIGLISLIVGLLIGVVLSQVSTIFIANIFNANLKEFQFIFSLSSLIKTSAYFGLIFILVMVFNILVLRKYKIISLLKANKRNENTKLRNKYVLAIAFIMSLLLYWYAYDQLYNLFGAVIEVGPLIISGSIATYLFYYSVSGVIINLISKYKPLYYKGLNIFTLRQINSRINSRVLSTSVITLLVLLTIATLSISTSLVKTFNDDYDKYMIADMKNRIFYNDTDIYGPQKHSLTIESEYVSSSINGFIYENESFEYDNLFTKEAINKSPYKEIFTDIPEVPNFITLSDYNRLMKFSGNEKITLKDNEVVITSNFKIVADVLIDSMKDIDSLTINNNVFKIKNNEVVDQQILMDMYPSNETTIVIPDKYIDTTFKVNYQYSMSELIDDEKNRDIYAQSFSNDCDFFKAYDNGVEVHTLTTTAAELEESSMGSTALMTFLGLYMGIILCITSASVLAIQQLSSASDSKENYKVLSNLGATNKMRNKALLIEIAVVFLLPIIVGSIHAIFGIAEINNFIMLMKQIDLTDSNIFVMLFILIGYGAYFLATYLCSKALLKDN